MWYDKLVFYYHVEIHFPLIWMKMWWTFNYKSSTIILITFITQFQSNYTAQSRPQPHMSGQHAGRYRLPWEVKGYPERSRMFWDVTVARKCWSLLRKITWTSLPCVLIWQQEWECCTKYLKQSALMYEEASYALQYMQLNQIPFHDFSVAITLISICNYYFSNDNCIGDFSYSTWTSIIFYS